MAIFEINGKSADNLNDAIELCREVWAEAKAPAVEEQHVEALSKLSAIDKERAAHGITVSSQGGTPTIGRN